MPGLQAPQAPLAVFADLVGAETGTVAVDFRKISLAIDRVVHLGREHDGVASPAALREPSADDLLGVTVLHGPAINIGRIEEVDAELEGAIHDRVAVLLGRVPAKVHRAQAQITDEDAVFSQSAVLHSHFVSLKSDVKPELGSKYHVVRRQNVAIPLHA